LPIRSKRLADLRDAGVLTDQEFQTKKAERRSRRRQACVRQPADETWFLVLLDARDRIEVVALGADLLEEPTGNAAIRAAKRSRAAVTG
jgi:hypothetical protein